MSGAKLVEDSCAEPRESALGGNMMGKGAAFFGHEACTVSSDLSETKIVRRLLNWLGIINLVKKMRLPACSSEA